MAWVRIHDGALTHPKIVGLSDSAFRLWVWGLSYCQQHLTDGWIPPAALPAKSKHDALVDARLWVYAAQGGFDVHDYLEWNDSKESVLKKRASLRERVTRYRRDDTQRARNASATSGVVKSSDLTTTTISEGESEGKPQPKQAGPKQNGRIFLHRWQVESLIATLGPHSDTFNLDVWLDDLNAQIATRALPRNPWKFVQEALHAEVRRRGLDAVADVSARPQMVASDSSWEPFRCPHDPECHGRSACALRTQLDAMKAGAV
jgi:hypothetical protein